MVESLGANRQQSGHRAGHAGPTKAAVRKGMKGDILLTTGGASWATMTMCRGVQGLRHCHRLLKIAMRPGKPFMYVRNGKLHVMGFPGNPVSALVTRGSS